MAKARFKKYIYKYKYLLEEIKEHDAFFKEKIDEWNELFGEFNVNEPDKHTDCGTDNCCQNCESTKPSSSDVYLTLAEPDWQGPRVSSGHSRRLDPHIPPAPSKLDTYSTDTIAREAA